MAANQPWGQNIGPLNLGVNPAPRPKGATEVLPKFSGDGKVSTDDHLSVFHSACAVISVPTQEVAVRLFVRTLTDAAADWFNHLPHLSITSWDDMKSAFENRFKTPENECSLFSQLSQMKKDMHEPMREFVAKFNRLVQRIPMASRPSEENQKSFFINAVPADISFHLIKDVCADLGVAQRLAIQLEDAFINAGKWKREVHTPRTVSFATPTDPVLQKLMNDIAMLKRQQNKTHNQYPSPYQDIQRWQKSQNFGRTPLLTAPQPRLQIKEAPKETMCSFHMMNENVLTG